MNDRKFEIIQQLMKELKDEMQYGGDELSERLGRKKPDVEVVKVQGSMEDPDLEKAEEAVGMDLDEDMEMGEDPEHAAMIEDDPDEKLKSRLMKLRGA